jgi:hypothetical protein
MIRKIFFSIAIILFGLTVNAQLKEFKCTDEWIQKIEKLAPGKANNLCRKNLTAIYKI